MNIPTCLTLARIAMIPVFITLFYLPFTTAKLGAAVVFVLAAVTDWFDGYLARRLNQESRFGAFLDPVADKIMVASVLVLMVAEPQGYYIAIPAAIIVAREITVSALREWMAEVGERARVRVSWLGKLKTFTQMVAIIALLFAIPLNIHWGIMLGYIGLYGSAVLTIWSMTLYIQASVGSFKIFGFKKKKSNHS